MHKKVTCSSVSYHVPDVMSETMGLSQMSCLEFVFSLFSLNGFFKDTYPNR
ncbi:hypothetical protein LEP1GSC199_1483 [Leptospira vanthielii serovar Holland str. Waz Holland = ATCC 700522]|uniref:Uncharacterized protein n=1 Tax=Leptospira vanthielii serovar Holland str. Waz Holland = ATCC 700522 TaxID=1218591 RepID=N1W8L4_9LEPT|nr:hypothetical protein LEP1GSC199_1483 [Leptospira vanthielii serovar Holland str. Waz Holland = ATCC 700522]